MTFIYTFFYILVIIIILRKDSNMTKKLIQNYYIDDNDTNIIKIEQGKSASYLYSSFLHSHTCLEICLVLDNDITYSIDNAIYEAKKNEIIIVNAVQEHKILTPQKQINALFLHIPFFESDKIIKSIVIFKNKIINNNLSFLIKEFYSNKVNNLSYKSVRLTANLLNIIVALLDCAIDNKDIRFTKQKIDILYYVENNYKNLTLEQISNYFSYNKSYFSRLFKTLFKINFHEFLIINLIKQ